MSLSDKIERNVMANMQSEDVKKFIKEVIENGEVLKNGAFVINYKKFKELAGDKLI